MPRRTRRPGLNTFPVRRRWGGTRLIATSRAWPCLLGQHGEVRLLHTGYGGEVAPDVDPAGARPDLEHAEWAVDPGSEGGHGAGGGNHRRQPVALLAAEAVGAAVVARDVQQ